MVLVVRLTGFRRPEAGARTTTMQPRGGQDHDNPPPHPVPRPLRPAAAPGRRARGQRAAGSSSALWPHQPHWPHRGRAAGTSPRLTRWIGLIRWIRCPPGASIHRVSRIQRVNPAADRTTRPSGTTRHHTAPRGTRTSTPPSPGSGQSRPGQPGITGPLAWHHRAAGLAPPARRARVTHSTATPLLKSPQLHIDVVSGLARTARIRTTGTTGTARSGTRRATPR
jgi:hypothetical protein